jgi:hypothetical protein
VDKEHVHILGLLYPDLESHKSPLPTKLYLLSKFPLKLLDHASYNLVVEYVSKVLEFKINTLESMILHGKVQLKNGHTLQSRLHIWNTGQVVKMELLLV